MPKPATLGSEELLGYGLRRANFLTLGTCLSTCRRESSSGVRTAAQTTVRLAGYSSPALPSRTLSERSTASPKATSAEAAAAEIERRMRSDWGTTREAPHIRHGVGATSFSRH